MPTNKSHWIAPIAGWAVWEPAPCEGNSTSSPDVAFVEPMLRRRLSRLAKMSLRVAYDCAHDVPDVRFVYASRHGEITRTTAMLNDLAVEEGVSPSAFSMSVLNASTGLFSILQHNTAPSTAISAMAESFGYGLLEACLQLADKPEQPVLLVYADEAISAVYGEPALSNFSAHAIGLLLQNGAARQITCAMTTSDQSPSLEPQSRAFLRCLEGGHANWQGDATSWAWSTRQQ